MQLKHMMHSKTQVLFRALLLVAITLVVGKWININRFAGRLLRSFQVNLSLYALRMVTMVERKVN